MINILLSFETWNSYVTKYFLLERYYFNGYKWTPFIKVKLRRRKKLLIKMRELVDVQGSNGNWNYDPYMHGMYGGMELMLAIIEGREPRYKDAPSEWLCDKKVDIGNPTSRVIGD